MRWKVVSDRPLYTDEWLDIRLADVELPDGSHLAHRWIRTAPGAGVVAIDGANRVLLIWRHRFITDTWGWEIPLGKIEEGEPPIRAAAREFEEETGWRAVGLRHLMDVQPTPGLSNSVHHVFVARAVTRIGEPVDAFESERVDWVPLSDVLGLTERGDVVSGTTLAALLYVLARSADAPAHGGSDGRLALGREIVEVCVWGSPITWAGPWLSPRRPATTSWIAGGSS